MNRRVGVVIRREFWTTVRRPSYLISTLGMPLFMLLIGGVSMIPALVIAKKTNAPQTIGIVDASGFLGLKEEINFSVPPPAELEQVTKTLQGRQGSQAIEQAFSDATSVRLRPFAALDEGQAAVRSKAIASLIVFPEDFLAQGQVISYSRESLLGGEMNSKKDLLRQYVVERLLAGRLDPQILERVRHPMSMRAAYVLGKDGGFEPMSLSKILASFFVPLLFTILFFISVMMSSGFLLQGVSEEKENRVIEVILSSIDPDSLLMGKLIGLGGAGLLQIAIWLGIGATLQGLAALALRSSGVSVDMHLRPGALLWSFLFYLLGYLLMGILLTGTGSIGQNLKESQQYSMMWTLGSVVPMASMMLLLTDPNSLYARILSYIPLTAPVTMFLRLNSIEPPPLWETALVAAVLAASVWISFKLMTRIFRVGLLLYGKRPTIPEIFKLMRRPAA